MLKPFNLFNFAIICIFLSVTIPSYAIHLHKEKEYQEFWCNKAGGVMEYVLDDRTRVDCLTDEYAIEFDFAPKWAESVGQALYYGLMTGKKPGVVLILEKEDDDKYLRRLQTVAARHKLKIWTVAP